jgi:hypothetical protein
MVSSSMPTAATIIEHINFMRFEVFKEVRMMMMFSWVLSRVDSSVGVNVSEKHTVSIFRAEVVMLQFPASPHQF